MKPNRLIRLVTVSALITGMSFNMAWAQQKPILCGTDIMTQKLLDEHPELLEKYIQTETFTQNYVKALEAQKAKQKASHKAAAANDTGTVYIIPIVFHILEENGPENISDAQIMSEIKILNQDWGHKNPDTGYAVTSHFKSIEGNMQVQFRLARIDPQGNCTNGIDRIYTNLTNQATDASKLDQWDRTKYLNVWVCKSINSASAQGGTILGYAYLPFEVDDGSFLIPYDGVLIADYCIGDTGTALTPPANLNAVPKEFSRCLSHEIGHVMNLEHPFGLTNSPGITGPYQITAGVVCGDDAVGDTPLTKGFYSYCPTGIGNDLGPESAMIKKDTIYAEICDTLSYDTATKKYHILLENYQNFMDYSECSMMFTVGQQERVWATLNNTVAERNSLWDTANLIATGVYTPQVACAPVANFYSNTCFVCQGAKVNFYDNSTTGTPTQWDWRFTGATVDNSSLQNPVVTYDSLYRQNVTETVSNSIGSSTQTQAGYVFVSPGWSSYSGTYSEGFENAAEVDDYWMFYNEFNDGVSWQYTNSAASTGTGSLMLNSYQHAVYNYEFSPPLITVPATGAFAVWTAISPSIDLSTTSAMTFSFDYSCATESTNPIGITDTLEVDYSLTCGASWFPMKDLVGVTLPNAGHYVTSYTPSSAGDWEHVSITVPSGVNKKSNVRFMFRYVSGAYSNNVYIDNVNLNGTVGVVPVTADEYHLLVYPNPTSSQATISYSLPAEQFVNIGLYDITGRELKELANANQAAGQHVINIQNGELSNGIYFIKMNSGNSSIAQKLVVIK